MSDAEPMSYIGRKACGCIVAAVVDMQDHKKETAKAVRQFISDGLTIERVTSTPHFSHTIPLYLMRRYFPQ